MDTFKVNKYGLKMLYSLCCLVLCQLERAGVILEMGTSVEKWLQQIGQGTSLCCVFLTWEGPSDGGWCHTWVPHPDLNKTAGWASLADQASQQPTLRFLPCLSACSSPPVTECDLRVASWDEPPHAAFGHGVYRVIWHTRRKVPSPQVFIKLLTWDIWNYW